MEQMDSLSFYQQKLGPAFGLFDFIPLTLFRPGGAHGTPPGSSSLTRSMLVSPVLGYLQKKPSAFSFLSPIPCTVNVGQVDCSMRTQNQQACA